MSRIRSRIILTLGLICLCAAVIGWYHIYSSGQTKPGDNALPFTIIPAPQSGSIVDSEEPELALKFDRGDTPDSEKTMRFGIVLPHSKHPDSPTGFKQLTWHPEGLTSNACLKIDGQEILFGHAPGKWVAMEAKLADDPHGNPRLGRKSVWVTPDKIQVIQTVEIVRGLLTGKLDTCRVNYEVENQGKTPRKVALRYLLDTFIGSNDGAPFIVPKLEWLCETQWEFNDPVKIPPYVFALEQLKLADPGVAAKIGLRLRPPVEAPCRLTLGGWPNDKKIKSAKSGLTLWDVPVVSLKKMNDSAAVIYWPELDLPPGGKRQLGFGYGLSCFTSNKDGSLGMFLAGDPQLNGKLTVTALLKYTNAGRNIRLKPSPMFEFVECESEQIIIIPPIGDYSFSPVTWTLRVLQHGELPFRLETDDGKMHEHAVRISR
jgi:hypothetical protein